MLCQKEIKSMLYKQSPLTFPENMIIKYSIKVQLTSGGLATALGYIPLIEGGRGRQLESEWGDMSKARRQLESEGEKHV